MKWKPDVTTVLLVVVLAFTASVWWRLGAIDTGLTRIVQHYEEAMQTATSTVTNTTGVTITVATIKLAGESDADWIARHTAAVTAAKDS